MYSDKSGCIPATWLYLAKSDCIRAKLVVFGKIGVFGQSGCNPVRWLFWGKRGCIRAKVVVFGQK